MRTQVLGVILAALMILPAGALAAFTFTYDHDSMEAEVDETAILHAVLTNTGDAEATFTLTLTGVDIPEDWLLSLCADGSCFPPYPMGESHTYTIAAGVSDSTVSADFFVNSEGIGSTWLKIEEDGAPDLTDSTQFTVYTPNDVEDVNAGQPHTFNLAPVYPNPFNSTALVQFSLPQTAPVKLQVYTPLGQVVGTIYEGALAAGRHEFTFHAPAQLASGMYLVTLRAGMQTAMTRAVLVK